MDHVGSTVASRASDESAREKLGGSVVGGLVRRAGGPCLEGGIYHRSGENPCFNVKSIVTASTATTSWSQQIAGTGRERCSTHISVNSVGDASRAGLHLGSGHGQTSSGMM